MWEVEEEFEAGDVVTFWWNYKTARVGVVQGRTTGGRRFLGPWHVIDTDGASCVVDTNRMRPATPLECLAAQAPDG